FERDGIRWYRTGDTGEIDGDVLRVTGRLDDVIKSGGVAVSLAQVERVIRGIDGLAEAVVVPAPSVEWGTVPVVVTSTAAELATIRQVVADALGNAARPERVVVVTEIPLLDS